MIRVKIVFRVTNKSVTEKLLREPNLQKAIDICMSSDCQGKNKYNGISEKRK